MIEIIISPFQGLVNEHFNLGNNQVIPSGLLPIVIFHQTPTGWKYYGKTGTLNTMKNIFSND